MHVTYFLSPFGEMILGVHNERLILCDWRYRKLRAHLDKKLQRATQSEWREETHPLHTETKQQILSYAKGERKTFDLPISPIGTSFQQTVWRALLEIPFGETVSYLKLAEKLQKPKAIRAVAAANGANILSLVVPCHRVIGSTGELVGYAGGLATKKKLLRLENALNDPQLSLF